MDKWNIQKRKMFCGLLCLLILPQLFFCHRTTNELDSKVVAKINDSEITVKDFRQQFKAIHPNMELAKADTTLKRQVLDNMIEQQLLLMEAYRLNYDEEKEVTQLLDSKERELAAGVLEKQVLDMKPVNNELIRTYYKWLDNDYDLSIFELKTGLFNADKERARQKADDIYTKLHEGADFNDLAAKYSQHHTAKQDSGKLTNVNCFDIDYEIFNQVNSLEEGEYSKPFYADNAFYIVRIDKIYNRQVENFDTEKEELINDIEEYYKNKKAIKTVELYKYLRNKNHYRTFADNIDFFCKRTWKMTAREDTSGLFSKSEKERVLSKTDVEEITIGAFLPKVVEYYWDSLTQKRVVLMLLEYMNNKRLTKHEAMEMKLNELPLVRKNVEKWAAFYLKNSVMRQEIIEKVDVADDILKNIYEKQKIKYNTGKKAIVREIFCKTQDMINEVYDKARNNENFELLEQSYNQNKESRTHGLLGPFARGRHGILGETAFNGMKMGDVSKPFRYRGGYSIIKMVDMQPARFRTFQEVKTEIKTNYIEENKEKYFSNWFQNVKDIYNIQIFELP